MEGNKSVWKTWGLDGRIGLTYFSFLSPVAEYVLQGHLHTWRAVAAKLSKLEILVHEICEHQIWRRRSHSNVLLCLTVWFCSICVLFSVFNTSGFALVLCSSLLLRKKPWLIVNDINTCISDKDIRMGINNWITESTFHQCSYVVVHFWQLVGLSLCIPQHKGYC